MLDRNGILAADDLPREEVDVPEWNGKVWVSTFWGDDRDRFITECYARREGGAMNYVGLSALIAALTICDEAGNRLFTEADVVALGKKSGAALDRVWKVAARLNHLLPEDLEELAGN